MKVTEGFRSEDNFKEYDYRDAYSIETSNGTTLIFRDDEPEDNTLSRSFSDVYKISKLIKEAHAAGLAGEELIFEKSDIDK